MRDRLSFRDILEEVLGSGNLYFQPPANIHMKYPCIRYTLADIPTEKADNIRYKSMRRYEVTVITNDPDDDIHLRLLDAFEYASFNRFYVADNLNHFALTIYY